MPWDKSNLPSNVQKLGDKEQRQWMHVANSCLKDGKDEGTCIRMANGVAKKELPEELAADLDVGMIDPAEIDAAAKSYQYVDSYEYESRKMSQEEAAYNPVGGDGTKACSNCMFFISPARCSVVSGEIAPNGVSNQWRAVRTYTPEPIPVVIVEKEAGAVETVVDQTVRYAPNLLSRLASLIPGVKQALPDAGVGTGFKVVKSANGELRWFSRFSNNWLDRDGEIIPASSHKEYTDWVNKSQFYPELWLWHTAGTKFGKADWIDFADGFMCASGTIDDTPAAKSIVEYLGNQEIGVSHGFLQVKEGNLITKYRTFEISPLPLKRAANWTTDFSVIGKESQMGFTAEKRQFLVGALGEDAVKQLEASTEQTAKQMQELGVEFKSLEAPPAPAPPPAAPAVPAATVAQAQPAAVAPVAAAAVQDAGYKAFAPIVQDLMEGMGKIGEAVTTLAAEVKALKATDDEKVTNMFAQKAAAVGAFQRPSDEPNTTIPAAAAKEQSGEDFFAANILKGFGAAGAAMDAAAVPGTPAVAAVTVQ
jgi:uncharacterized protein YdaT